MLLQNFNKSNGKAISVSESNILEQHNYSKEYNTDSEDEASNSGLMILKSGKFFIFHTFFAVVVIYMHYLDMLVYEQK